MGAGTYTFHDRLVRFKIMGERIYKIPKWQILIAKSHSQTENSEIDWWGGHVPITKMR